MKRTVINKRNGREVAASLLGVAVAVILWLTIFQREGKTENPFAYRPFHTLYDFWDNIGRYGIKGNFLGNILIFIPVGILYPVAFGSRADSVRHERRKTTFFGFCLSILIEITQLVFSKGFFEIDDMILNIVGTVSGYCLYRFIVPKTEQAIIKQNGEKCDD